MDQPQRAKQHLQEARAFVSEAYTVWASLQKIVEEYEATAPTSGFRLGRNVPEPPPAEQVQYYGRVCKLYRETIAKQLPLVKSDPTLSHAQKSTTLSHYATTLSILALSEILYFPSDGLGEGLVGEELLDWVNTVDRAPSAEEGAALSQLSTPWDSPSFFPYLTRCLLRGHLSSASALLSLLSSTHPSPFLQKTAKYLTDLVATYPRSTNFRTEPAFLSALRAWKSNLSASTRSLQALFSSSASDPVLDADEKSEWTAFLSTLLSLLSGSSSHILDLSEDWREALAAWGLWVNPGSFRREDLPTLVTEVVTKELPVDGTLDEEVAMEKLLVGDVAGVLKSLTGSFPWLATHLADLLSHLHLPAFDPPSSTTNRLLTDEAEKEQADELPLGLREHFLLDWAERLTVDEGLWRVSCEYWGACGEEGRRRARSLLKNLRLDDPTSSAQEAPEGEVENMDVEAGEGENYGKSREEQGKGRKTRRVEEVLRVCADLGLEEEMVEICQSYAAHLTAEKRYGEAIAFSVRAADSRRIAEIAGLILEAYIEEGQDSFINHVDSIPTSLLRPNPSNSASEPSSPTSSTFSSPSDEADLFPSAPPSALTPYSSTLSFLARYRDFFALYSRDGGSQRGEAARLLVLLLTSGVCPEGWRAVGLLDCLPLLETSPPLISLAETYDLLRILEDVVGPVVSQTPPADVFGHLDKLGRLTEARGDKGKKGGEKAKGEEEVARDRTSRALEQMEVVRGALARHLALCCCLE
ncbi:hypothetical protein JCM11251_000992 [Rhodosporidiobolus azoricus]